MPDTTRSLGAHELLPTEIVEAVEDCGFFESIPLWAVTLIGGLFITVLSFIMIMSVHGRFSPVSMLYYRSTLYHRLLGAEART